MKSNWSIFYSDEGVPYYFNSKTEESLWDKPEELKTEIEKKSLWTVNF